MTKQADTRPHEACERQQFTRGVKTSFDGQGAKTPHPTNGCGNTKRVGNEPYHLRPRRVTAVIEPNKIDVFWRSAAVLHEQV